jgi:hypothetical protein
MKQVHFQGALFGRFDRIAHAAMTKLRAPSCEMLRAIEASTQSRCCRSGRNRLGKNICAISTKSS